MSNYCQCCCSDTDWVMTHLDPQHSIETDDDPDYVAADFFRCFPELDGEISEGELAQLVSEVQEIYARQGEGR